MDDDTEAEETSAILMWSQGMEKMSLLPRTLLGSSPLVGIPIIKELFLESKCKSPWKR
jgi:hypothetical protein